MAVDVTNDGILPPQQISPDPPRQHFGHLVFGMRTGRDAENTVEFLQRALLSLWQEEEDEKQRNNVQPGVEPKRSLGLEVPQHVRKRQRQHGGPEVVGRHRPRHANLAVRQREDLGGVGERDGAFAGGVEDIEQVNEQGDQAEMGATTRGNPETESGRQQGPAHIGEGGEQEPTTAKRVDGPDGGPGEEEVHQAKAEGRKQGLDVRGAGLLKDGGRVERDDVDCFAV